MKGKSCSCLIVLMLVFLFAVAGVLFYIAYPVVFAPPPTAEETVWPETVDRIPRSEWGSATIANPDRISAMGDITRITIHHDGLPKLAMVTEKQIKNRVVSIRESHSKKYADIGYHYIVDPKGRVWEGRPIKYQGAHVKGENSNNVGILFLGNTDEDEPTEAGLNGLYTFIRYLRQRYEVDEDAVFTHRELGQTDCPGKALREQIEIARKDGSLKLPEPSTAIDWAAVLDEGKDFLSKIKGKLGL